MFYRATFANRNKNVAQKTATDVKVFWDNNPDAGAIVDPLVITVDPTTGAVTVPENLTFGDYGIKATTGSGSSGTVLSCTGQIDIKVHIILPAPYGDQGLSRLVLQKQ